MQITKGKSKAARRVLPMLPPVYDVLSSRQIAQNEPTEGWVFPSDSACGHFEGSTAKGFHARAIKKANEDLNEQVELKKFEPYVMRHTALTRLGESGCDVFTLARIAGHSSITMTMRLVARPTLPLRRKQACQCRAFRRISVCALQPLPMRVRYMVTRRIPSAMRFITTARSEPRSVPV